MERRCKSIIRGSIILALSQFHILLSQNKNLPFAWILPEQFDENQNAFTLQAVAHYFYNVINYNLKNKETSGDGIGGIANPIIKVGIIIVL